MLAIELNHSFSQLGFNLQLGFNSKTLDMLAMGPKSRPEQAVSGVLV
jgi:hypothetical protein